jgi:hypothetical protein
LNTAQTVPIFKELGALKDYLRQLLLPRMMKNHQEIATLIRRDTEAIPITKEEMLQAAIELQYQQMRLAEVASVASEIAAAKEQLAQIQFMKRLRDERARMAAPHIQEEMQEVLAETETRHQIANVETVSLNDIVDRKLATHTPLQGLTALQYIAQGGARATAELPVEISPRTASEMLHAPQQDGNLLTCEREEDESMPGWFERCKLAYSEKYGKLPSIIHITEDGRMIAEGK